MLFSRMWNDRMASSYKSWSGGTDGAPIKKENLTYFFTYQLNYMYWRLFSGILSGVKMISRDMANRSMETGSRGFLC